MREAGCGLRAPGRRVNGMCGVLHTVVCGLLVRGLRVTGICGAMRASTVYKEGEFPVRGVSVQIGLGELT